MKPFYKIAFSHDWLNGMRGGEKCLEALCEGYPSAPIFTLFAELDKLSPGIRRHRLHTSFIQRLPLVRQHYRYYLPLFPKGIEGFRLEGYDAVVSLSHCVSKGIRPNPEAAHVCYCFTPMRYAWLFFEEYFGNRNVHVQKVLRGVLESLKQWDLQTNERVDRFIAISKHVQERIQRFYGKKADVVYPPVNTDFFSPDGGHQKEDFYLIVSALVPYKRLEVAIRAFSRLKKKLVVIGDGPEKAYLKNLSTGDITFLGWQSDEVLRDHYRRAKALVFPGEEDFGIVPVEMQACGGFVIAYGKGGVEETVLNGTSGVLYEGDGAGLVAAIERFEKLHLNPAASRQNAIRFSRPRFIVEMQTVIQNTVDAKRGHAAC